MSAGPTGEIGSGLAVGTRLFEFEIKRILGEGGFGIVYLAFDHSLHRLVAIKEYFPCALAFRCSDSTVAVRSVVHQSTFEAGLDSFIQEARLLAQFDHPALVKVHRFWEANGTGYMAMHYYQGGTLKTVLKAYPGYADEAVLKTLIAPLLDAVATLHLHKCCHRDISPDNIIVQPNGAAVLLDFGAARRIIGDMTHALTAVLKPGYAPIEQYGDEIGLSQGPWTDIYALAATLYFAVAGKAPPPAVTRVYKDSLVPLQHDAPAGYTRQYLSGINAGLAVRPENRPQSIAAFRKALGLEDRRPERDLTTERPNPTDTPSPQVGLLDDADRTRPVGSLASTSMQTPRVNAGTNRSPWRRISASVGVVAVGLAVIAAAMLAYWHFRSDLASDVRLMERTDASARGVAKDDVEAVKLYRKSADQGDALGQNNLGVMYENGRGVAKDDVEAVKWYRKSADQGYALGQKNLGFMYESGRGVAKDDVEAVKWYRKSADQGNALGQYYLGTMYASGRGVAKDDVEAVKWYRKSADQGNAASQRNLGLMYENGRGVAEDDVEAVKWYRKSADQGHAFGQNNLAFMYENGRGVPKDDAEAAKWYRRSADQGSALGQYNLAVMYANGRGVAKDDAEAVKWYRKAADQGHSTAQDNLGTAYASGRGVTKDDAEAVKWYRKSADQGYAFGQNNLGFMYANGRGVAKDDAEAVKWYHEAAEQGHATAQDNLGTAYASGRGVAKDDAEAVKWYRKSADQGYSLGERNLGFMYENGRGVAKDDVEAVKWYRKSADQGDEYAKSRLEKLDARKLS